MRRELWQLLNELVESVQPDEKLPYLLQITEVSLDLPLEIQLLTSSQGTLLLADVTRWRWQTLFDLDTSHLSITFSLEKL